MLHDPRIINRAIHNRRRAESEACRRIIAAHAIVDAFDSPFGDQLARVDGIAAKQVEVIKSLAALLGEPEGEPTVSEPPAEKPPEA